MLHDYDATTYGDGFAEIYDDLYPGLDERAIGVLARLAGPGGRALELGIGTGRIALPLAAAGVRVEGLDASEAMVEQLRAKPGGASIPVTIGDFCEMRVEGLFDLIYVPFNTFYLLHDQDAQLRCMRGVAEHLRPGGAFVVEVFVPDLERFNRGQYVSAPRIGRGAVALDVAHLDVVQQRITSEYMVLAKDYVRLYPVQLRYVWPAELDLMAKVAGLRLCERWSGWGCEPFTESSKSQIAVYVKD